MPVFSFSPGLDARHQVLAAREDAPQPVHLGVVAQADEAALPDGEGGLVHNGGGDELPQLGQVVQGPAQGGQQRRRRALQQLPQPGQPAQARRQGHQIPAPSGAVDDAADEPLQVGDLPQGGTQLLPADGVAHQFLHRPQPLADGHGGEEGPLHPRPDQPVAHGGAGLVQHPQQAALLLLGAQGLGELQVAPGGEVQLHVLPGGQPGQGGDVGQVGFLGLVQVAQKAPRRLDRPLRPLRDGLQPGGKLLFGGGTGGIRPEPGLPAVFTAAVQLLGQKVHQGGVTVGPVGQHGLPGPDPAQLVVQALLPLRSGGEEGGGELAGGHVAHAQAGAGRVPVDGADEVVPPLLQHGGVHHRAGGDNADDVPVHQPLGGGRVLHLLADGDFVPLGDEPGDIGVGGVVGHPTHGGALFRRLVPVPGGEGEVQLGGHQLGVLLEHLVKIPQPEKQDAVRVELLHLHILLHHGGQFRRHSGSPVLSIEMGGGPYSAGSPVRDHLLAPVIFTFTNWPIRDSSPVSRTSRLPGVRAVRPLSSAPSTRQRTVLPT